MGFSEADTRAKLITPNLLKNGWNENNIIREYTFTAGKKLIGNKRGEKYRVDYLLKYKNINLAIVEAKKENLNYLDGLQQVINYGEKLNVEFVYTTNGHKIFEYSIREEQGKEIENFPSPEELFKRKFNLIDDKKDEIITQPFYSDGEMKPRFYQEIAIRKTVEAISNQQKRILLTLATGTGKTYIAFQIVYLLFQAKWNINGTNRRPKILFLADRNILKYQAFNTFNPLEKDCVDINGKAIKKNGGKVKTAGNIFFALYQSLSSGNSEDISEEDKDDNLTEYYKQYPKDFFDLVIIDECHRGSASDESSWREILNYFESAVHLGLTATPKREDNVDTYKYFGEPIYKYSLKDGINDGFLTPYKVKRIQTNIDEYRFNPNDEIKGELKSDIVKLEQFEKEVIIPKRTDLIAKTIIKNINKFDKTIIFCVNQQHAIEMKVAINKFKKVKNNNYCVRVTSNEGELGRKFLEQFQNNDLQIPTILTSSKMLTTGVDARNVRNIVLTASINSMTEFKQIIGRGTRIFEGKDFFTIIDFVDATKKFYDPEWDDNPEEIEEKPATPPTEGEPTPPTEPPITEPPQEPQPKEKVIINIKHKKLKVIDIETTYVGADGKPLKTEEYLKFLIGILGKFYNDEKKLREIWSNPKNRKEMLKKLSEMGIVEENLNDLKKIFEAKESDIYDVLAHLSFNLDIKTREERILSLKNSEFVKNYHNQKVKNFIEFILERYKKDGVKELDDKNLARLVELSGNNLKELKKEFGTVKIRDEFLKLQKNLYK